MARSSLLFLFCSPSKPRIDGSLGHGEIHEPAVVDDLDPPDDARFLDPARLEVGPEDVDFMGLRGGLDLGGLGRALEGGIDAVLDQKDRAARGRSEETTV